MDAAKETVRRLKTFTESIELAQGIMDRCEKNRAECVRREAEIEESLSLTNSEK